MRTPPRTFTYYAAYEIAHSLTAEKIGPARLWNWAMPQWVREGYADYVGFGGGKHIDDLYRRYRPGDPELDWQKSGTYARFRLLVAICWSASIGPWTACWRLRCHWKGRRRS